MARDIHNLIVPIDFSSYADVGLACRTSRTSLNASCPFARSRACCQRWHRCSSSHGSLPPPGETYGLVAVLDYLEASIDGAGRKFGAPQAQYFSKAIEGRKVRRDRSVLSLQDILQNADPDTRLHSATNYLTRLGVNGATSSIFINGIPITRNEEWLQTMSGQLTRDNRILQQAVYEESVGNDDYLPDVFLNEASLRRVPLVVPEDDKSIRHFDLGDLPELAQLPSIPASKNTIERELVHMTIVTDLDTMEGFQQMLEAWLFQKEHDNVELAFLHHPASPSPAVRVASNYDTASDENLVQSLLDTCDTLVGEDRLASEAIQVQDNASFSKRQDVYQILYEACSSTPKTKEDESIRKLWSPFSNVIQQLGLEAGHGAVVVNGRVVGPIKDSTVLEVEDLEAL